MNQEKTTVADLICEFLEVAFHNILYVRKLYPEGIFESKRKYGVVVYQSIHPEVNEYINRCLKAIIWHAKRNKLKGVFFCLSSQNRIIERIKFEFSSISKNLLNDGFLVDLESNLRTFCVKLHTSHTYESDLPDDCNFCIQIHTTEYSSTEFNQDPTFEDFPWVQINNTEMSLETPEIIPIHTIKTDYLILQTYIEKDAT